MRTIKGFVILTLALLFCAKALQWAGFTDQPHFGWVFLALSLIGIMYGAYTLNTEVAPDGTVRPLMTNTHIGWALGLTVMLITGLWATGLVTNTYTWLQGTNQAKAEDAKQAIKLKTDNAQVLSRCLQGIDERKAYIGNLYIQAVDEQIARLNKGEITIEQFDSRMDELHNSFVPRHERMISGCDKLLAASQNKTDNTDPPTTNTNRQTTKWRNPLTMAVEYFVGQENVWMKALLALIGMFIIMGIANELSKYKPLKFVGYLLWMTGLLVGIVAIWGFLKHDVNIASPTKQSFLLLAPKESAQERDVRNWGPDNTRQTQRVAPATNQVRNVNVPSVADENGCVHNDLLSYEQPWVRTNYGISNKPVVVTITRSTLAPQYSEPCGPDGCAEQRTPGILPYPEWRHMRMMARVGNKVVPFTSGSVILDPAVVGTGEVSISTNQVRRKPTMGLGASNEWRQMTGSFCFEVRYAAGT